MAYLGEEQMRKWRLRGFKEFVEMLRDEELVRQLVEHAPNRLYTYFKSPERCFTCCDIGIFDSLRRGFDLTRREAVLAFFALLSHPKVHAWIYAHGGYVGERYHYDKLMEEMGLDIFLRMISTWPIAERIRLAWTENPPTPPPSWKRAVISKLRELTGIEIGWE